MPAAAQPQPTPSGEVALRAPAAIEKREDRVPASVRLERIVGRDLAEVLVRGLARRLR